MAVHISPPAPLTGRAGRLAGGLAVGMLALVVGLLFGPAAARGDTPGGLGTAFTATRVLNTVCETWTPLFMHKYEGWSSVLSVNNYQGKELTAVIRMVGLNGSPIIYKSVDVPASSFVLLKSSDLGLPDGFAGSLSSNTCPLHHDTLAYADRDGSGRLLVEGAFKTDSMLFLPIVNDPPSVMSRVVVFNTDVDNAVAATVTYRVRGQEPVQQAVAIPKGAPLALDLSTAPRGAVGIEIQALPNTKLVAAVYETRSDGSVGANNAVPLQDGGRVVFLPLVYRKAGFDGSFSSTIRVMNLRQRPVQPRLSFSANDTGLSIGPLQTSVVLNEGEYADFPLTAIPELADGQVYSATVDFFPPGVSRPGLDIPLPVPSEGLNEDEFNANSAPLGVVSIASSTPRALELRYLGLTEGGRVSIAPLVFRRVLGLDSGIQLQNLGVNRTSVTVVFLDTKGRNITSWTTSIEGNGSTALYLPEVRGLPDGFFGAAAITSSSPVVAVSTALRYPRSIDLPSRPVDLPSRPIARPSE